MTGDLLLGSGTVLTMDPERRIVADGAVLVRDGRIAAVDTMATLSAAHPSARRIDARGGVILPGFVNTHTHLFQGLLKGPGDDRPLYRWLKEMTAPAARALTEEHCEAAALNGAVEALRSGATTIVDFMYAHPRPQLTDAVIRGLEATGIRALVARGFVTQGVELGIPAELIEPVDAALSDVARLRAMTADPERRVRVGIAPCLLWMVDEDALRATRAYADTEGLLVTYHLAETSFEVDVANRTYGCSETAFLERIGFLGPDLLAVHCTRLDDEEIARLADHDVKVSHNPVSNMYLASGVAPVPAMLDAGLTVALATDGPASNNNQNMLQVLKYAALLQKVAHEDAEALTAEAVLEMATIGGARAIGLEREIGSLEVGKRADIIVISLDDPFIAPVHDPVSSIVYAAVGNEVRTVLIDGELVLDEGAPVRIDQAAVLGRAVRAAEDLATRAGLPRAADRRWRPRLRPSRDDRGGH